MKMFIGFTNHGTLNHIHKSWYKLFVPCFVKATNFFRDTFFIICSMICESDQYFCETENLLVAEIASRNIGDRLVCSCLIYNTG